MDPSQLRNTYFPARHGKSQANASGIIVSTLEKGENDYGLTTEGQQVVRQNAETALAAGLLDRDAILIASPFLRCRETAKIIREVLRCGQVQVSVNLRERDFGELESGSSYQYETVWEKDKHDPSHTTWGVTSVLSVLDRMLDKIGVIEKSCSGRKIILVSHGDPLQILQTWFQGIPPQDHRSLQHLEPGEIRKMN